MTPDDLSARLLEFAVRVGNVVEALPGTRLGCHIADQLIRSGTAPGAHYEEACVSESRRDFLHKLRLAHKELRESRYWFRLIIRTNTLEDGRLKPLMDECEELCAILGRSISTAKGRLNANDN